MANSVCFTHHWGHCLFISREVIDQHILGAFVDLRAYRIYLVEPAYQPWLYRDASACPQF